MNWALLILLLLICIFLLLLIWFERSRTDEKTIAVIATLGTLAAVARVPFAGIPNVQPTTFMVMISGYVFGARVGFLVGCLAAVLSNVFLGQGPWTLWQMLSWGLVGSSGGLLSFLVERNRENEPLLQTRGKTFLFVAICTLWGFLFDWIMNLWIFTGYGEFMNWKSFVVLYSAGLAFDTFHAVGNLLFAAIFARTFARILTRYHRKLVVSRFTEEVQP
ncbi:ECF transporter S component [Brevibacillus ginsengisoli]|uniref:ECF transporter S component n=1 Tax=Brevibacillus ginsengisoli TaxID=363854 RepID=UPI003CE86CCB